MTVSLFVCVFMVLLIVFQYFCSRFSPAALRGMKSKRPRVNPSSKVFLGGL